MFDLNRASAATRAQDRPQERSAQRFDRDLLQRVSRVFDAPAGWQYSGADQSFSADGEALLHVYFSRTGFERDIEIEVRANGMVAWRGVLSAGRAATWSGELRVNGAVPTTISVRSTADAA